MTRFRRAAIAAAAAAIAASCSSSDEPAATANCVDGERRATSSGFESCVDGTFIAEDSARTSVASTTTATQPVETAAEAYDPGDPAQTIVVVTLPSTSTTLATTTSTTASPAPLYRTPREQVEYFTVGPARDQVIGDVLGLSSFTVSVDQLDVRHELGNVLFEISTDEAPEMVHTETPAILVAVTSEFSGGEAVAEEAWSITRYFAPQWSAGEPVRLDVDASPFANDLEVRAGYGLEIAIGRHLYHTSGPAMAAVADQRLSFADWERLATVTTG